MTTNEKAIRVLDDYFGYEWSPEACEIDAFYPGVGWVPVTRDSLLTLEGFHAARAQGVTAFSVRPRHDSNRNADFRTSELAPMAGLSY